MESESQNCVVIPVNRSDVVFQSSFSTIVRSFENFDPKILFILHAEFNKNLINSLDPLFKQLEMNGVEVKKVNLNQLFPYNINSSEEIANGIENLLQGCKKVYLVPTSGASIVSSALGILYQKNRCKNYFLVNYLFSFGPWISFYYPFTPRETERVIIDPEPNVNPSQSPPMPIDEQIRRLKKLDNYFQERIVEESKKNTFLGNMYKLVYEMNVRTEGVNALKITLPPTRPPESSKGKNKEEKDKKPPSSGPSSLTLKVNDMKNIKDKLESILGSGLKDLQINPTYIAEIIENVSGIHRIMVYDQGDDKKSSEKDLSEVAKDFDFVVIDTNLIYYGIHSYEIRGLSIPYCVNFEMGTKLYEEKKISSFYETLYSIYDAILLRARILPSEMTYCDQSIPKMDPDLLEGGLILTGDRRAFRVWSNSPLSKYATVKFVKLDDEIRNNESERKYSLLSIASLLMGLKDDIEMNVELIRD
ncbi:hypothetical protein [Sulfuracidifex metallicus]|uniref:hypothetical protein n=1 Tax=Sulfuracidifex metallicus TaxID=47303 RepID=UPI002272F15C|nr:hypothetical protein [Sulfuracidifex metallicus]MCY0849677.1 hypothetical protein [Sulfuracidifex metallicus]